MLASVLRLVVVGTGSLSPIGRVIWLAVAGAICLVLSLVCKRYSKDRPAVSIPASASSHSAADGSSRSDPISHQPYHATGQDHHHSQRQQDPGENRHHDLSLLDVAHRHIGRSSDATRIWLQTQGRVTPETRGCPLRALVYARLPAPDRRRSGRYPKVYLTSVSSTQHQQRRRPDGLGRQRLGLAAWVTVVWYRVIPIRMTEAWALAQL